MSFVVTLLITVQIIAAVAMIGLVLIQHGKGADMGAAFGSGASGSLFGATGSANFLSRTTAVLATIFFIATLALANFSNVQAPSSGSVLENPAALAAPEAASQIPGTTPPSAAGASVPAPVPASGPASQIPTK